MLGTFGAGSAGYWWGRLMGILARTSISITGRAILWQLIFADEFNLLAKGVDGIRAAVVSLFVMVIFGGPLLVEEAKGRIRV